jgi:hypothetical protein
MTKTPQLRWSNIHPPKANTALTELRIGSTQIDLNSKVQFIGLTWGADDSVVTMGWAAIAEVLVVRGAQVLPLDGLALQFAGLSRFELAFQGSEPGALEYFELQEDPEPTLLFYFEGGTIRLTPQECRGDLLFESDEEPESDEGPETPVQ